MAEEGEPAWMGLISRQAEVVPRVWHSGDSEAVLRVWDALIKNYSHAGSHTTGVHSLALWQLERTTENPQGRVLIRNPSSWSQSTPLPSSHARRQREHSGASCIRGTDPIHEGFTS